MAKEALLSHENVVSFPKKRQKIDWQKVADAIKRGSVAFHSMAIAMELVAVTLQTVSDGIVYQNLQGLNISFGGKEGAK
jgi:hypothetical protein